MRLIGLAVVLAFGVFVRPLVADAQETGRVYRLGFLRDGPPPDTFIAGLRRGLRDLGYFEGQNLRIEYGLAKNTAELPEVAARLVRLNIDALIASGTPPVPVAKNATQTIPVVFVASIDPVATGIVASLARPGGNVTGFAGIHSEQPPSLAANPLGSHPPRPAGSAVSVPGVHENGPNGVSRLLQMLSAKDNRRCWKCIAREDRRRYCGTIRIDQTQIESFFLDPCRHCRGTLHPACSCSFLYAQALVRRAEVINTSDQIHPAFQHRFTS